MARRALVSGAVQGVGFRWATRAEARRLGLGGWVRNLVDGRVEARFEGQPGAVSALERWLASGPPGARVERLSIEVVELQGLTGFKVVRPGMGDA